MGNKVSISPLANYEASSAMFNKNELSDLRAKFMNRSDDANSINLDKFIQKSEIESDYIQKHVLTKFFAVCDTKRDNMWDFEEYVCVVALFRYSTLEDRIKLVYFMYLDGNKSSVLLKENFRQIIVDCLVCLRKVSDEDRDIALYNGTTEKWVQELQLLSLAMTESNLLLYSNQVNKIDLNDFISFAKSEGLLVGLYEVFVKSIDS